MIDNFFRNQLFKDTVLITIASLSSKFIGFILLPIYTRALTPEQFGIGDLIFSLSSLLIPLVSLSSFDAVFRYMLKDNSDFNKKNLVSSVLSILLLGIISFTIGIIFLNLGSMDDFKIWLTISVSMGIINSFLQAYTKGSRQNRFLAYSGILGSIVTAVFAFITLNVLHLSLNGYFFTLTIGTTVSNCYLFIVTKVYKNCSYKYVNKFAVKKILKYSLPLIPNAISWWITSDISRIFIFTIIGSFGNGMFAVASKIPSLLNMFFGIFNQAWQITAINKLDGSKQGVPFLLSSIYRTLQVTSIMAGLLALLLPKIYLIIAPKAYFSSWKIVPMLMVGTIISMIAGQIGTYFLSKEKTKIILISTIVGMLLNTGLGFVLTTYFKLTGAAVTSAISFLIVTALRLKFLSKLEGTNIQLQIPWLAIIFFVVSVIVSYNFVFSWVTIILFIVISIIYFSISFRLIKIIR